MHSDINWPFDETYDEIHETLEALDEIINHYSDFARADYDPEKWQEIEEIYRGSHVLTLATILDLFNSRALSGEPFDPKYKESWKAYYKNMREILSAMEVVPLFPSTMDAVEQGRWLTSKKAVLLEHKFDILQTAALSAILIPEEDGKASDADCIAARSLIQPIITAGKVTSKVTAAYDEGIINFASAGVAEQIAGRIEMACPK